MNLAGFVAPATIIGCALSGCGGGSSGGAPQPVYTIGGSIAGLSAAGLTLADGGNTASPGAGATTFSLASPLPTGASYSVVIKSQPAGQTCNIANGVGSVGAANVINISVSCANTRTLAFDGGVSGIDAIVVGPNGTVYVGGAFTHVGPYSGIGAAFDVISGRSTQPDLAPVSPGPPGRQSALGASAAIYTVAADGTGGWFIAGSFTQVGNVTVKGFAHILANGALDQSFNIDVGSGESISTSVVSGSTLYIGGNFTAIDGAPRAGLAALSVATGALLPFNPNPSGGAIQVLMLSGTSLYVSGSFSSMGGMPRHGLAAVDTSSGETLPWSPVVAGGGGVKAFAISGNRLFLGGSFTAVNGTPRVDLAAVDPVSGALLSWDPVLGIPACPALPCPLSSVNAMAISGNSVYVGGQDLTSNLVAFDATTGAPIPWHATIGAPLPYQPSTYNSVSALEVLGTTLYIGGAFSVVNGIARDGLAAVEAASGAVLDWDPGLNGPVNTLAIAGNTIYAGGQFTATGTSVRVGVAALDSEGNLLPWNPNLTLGGRIGNVNLLPSVNALALVGNTLYVAGGFSANGGRVFGIAAIDSTTGVVSNWAPYNNFPSINAFAYTRGELFLGGFGVDFGALSLVDVSTGRVEGLSPSLGPPIYSLQNVESLAASNSTLYISGLGEGSLPSGLPAPALAAIAVSSDATLPWHVTTDDGPLILAIPPSGGDVYLGQVTNIEGQARQGIAKVDGTTGALLPWNPAINLSPTQIVVQGSTVFVGGFALPTRPLTAIDVDSGAVLPWNPAPDSDVLALAVSGNRVYVGGTFLSVNGIPRVGFAAVDANTGDVL